MRLGTAHGENNVPRLRCSGQPGTGGDRRHRLPVLGTFTWEVAPCVNCWLPLVWSWWPFSMAGSLVPPRGLISILLIRGFLLGQASVHYWWLG